MANQKNIPTVLVIFGATGDLMTKKITPALYNLFLKGKLPKLFRIVGVARRPLSRDEFRTHITRILEKNETFKIQKRLTEEFLNYFYYHQGTFDKEKDYASLAKELGRVDDEWKVCSNKLFYLSVPPHYYEVIFRHLASSGLTIPCGPDEGWTRVLVEILPRNNEVEPKDKRACLSKPSIRHQLYPALLLNSHNPFLYQRFLDDSKNNLRILQLVFFEF